MVLLIDNYDSFSYNLYQLLGTIHPEMKVVRNDELTTKEISALAPSHIILSPGPGRPEEAGMIMDCVRDLGGRIPILGVCLGHQAICASYGATVTYAKELMHGKASMAQLDTESPLFYGCSVYTQVARYHSLAVDPATLPSCLKVIARTSDGEIMGVAHTSAQVYGVQFHPESILTPEGKKMLENFLTETDRRR